MPWHAVYTEPRAEWGVAKALREAGLDVLYLYRATSRRSRHNGRQIGINVALYTRIVFARIETPEDFQAVRTTRNVRSIWRGRIRDDEIERERGRADPTGKVIEAEPRAGERLAPGTEVMVTHGAFVGFPAVVEVDTGAELRLNLVLFGRPTLAVVPKAWVETPTTRTAAQTQNQRRAAGRRR